MLLTLHSSMAQESSLLVEGESDVTGKSGSRAFRKYRLACDHVTERLEDLFYIPGMNDVFSSFKREYEAGKEVFLHSKADTNHRGSLCQMNITCCKPAMEKTAETLAHNEYKVYYDRIFKDHSESCPTPGKRLFRSSIEVMGEVVSNLEVKVNQSLGGTLPTGTFTNLRRYLIFFSGIADTCPLPQLLREQTQTIIELALTQLFKDDTDFGTMIEDPVSMECMKNVSSTLVQSYHMELRGSLEKQLHDLGLFVRATKLASHVLNVIRRYHLSESCTTAITRMQYCALCGSYGRFSPCLYMCINTLRGCFADLAELHAPFHRFTSLLRTLTKSLISDLKPDAFINAHLGLFASMVNHLQDKEGMLREQVSQKIIHMHIGEIE